MTEINMSNHFYRNYCKTYNILNSRLIKLYCNTNCPHYVGLSKNKKSICEWENERFLDKYLS